MKMTGKMWLAAVTFASMAMAGNANAAEIGWLDGVAVGMDDVAYGWVCENEDPFHTPEYGSIDVFLDGPAGFGIYYGNFPLVQGNYGYFKQGVNAAGFCGSNPYVSFEIWGWFSDPGGQSPNTIYVYWRDSQGNLTKIGGSGITMNKIGMNP
jgi:hypothetical protein